MSKNMELSSFSFFADLRHFQLIFLECTIIDVRNPFECNLTLTFGKEQFQIYDLLERVYRLAQLFWWSKLNYVFV